MRWPAAGRQHDGIDDQVREPEAVDGVRDDIDDLRPCASMPVLTAASATSCAIGLDLRAHDVAPAWRTRRSTASVFCDVTAVTADVP